jgi:hypothetical protein
MTISCAGTNRAGTTTHSESKSTNNRMEAITRTEWACIIQTNDGNDKVRKDDDDE